MPEILTTAQAAREVDPSGRVCEWQVRRLFEDGNLNEPPKFGGKRMIDRALLPAIRDALAARGWLQQEAAHA